MSFIRITNETPIVVIVIVVGTPAGDVVETIIPAGKTQRLRLNEEDKRIRIVAFSLTASSQSIFSLEENRDFFIRLLGPDNLVIRAVPGIGSTDTCIPLRKIHIKTN